MAGPITWKNVGTTSSSAGVSNTLQNASASFDRAFKNIGQFANAQKEQNIRDWDRQADANQGKLMDELYKYGSQEELQQARQQGVFKDMRQGMGDQYDAEAFRSALDSRGSTLQDRTLKTNEYQDDLTERSERSLRTEAMQAANAGDFERAREIAGGLQINGDEVLQDVLGTRMKINSDNRAGARLGMAQESHGQSMERGALQIEQLENQIGQEEVSRNLSAMGSETLARIEENPNQADQITEGYIEWMKNTPGVTNQMMEQALASLDSASLAASRGSAMGAVMHDEQAQEIIAGNGAENNIYVADFTSRRQGGGEGSPGGGAYGARSNDPEAQTREIFEYFQDNENVDLNSFFKGKDVENMTQAFREGVAIPAHEVRQIAGLRDRDAFDKLGIEVDSNGMVRVPVTQDMVINSLNNGGRTWANDNFQHVITETLKDNYIPDYIQSISTIEQLNALENERNFRNRN